MTDEDASYYEDERQWGEDSMVNAAHHEVRFETTRRMLPRRVASLVDVGAGDGRLISHLLGHEDPPDLAVAVDRSFAAVRHVGSRAVRATGTSLPFPDRSFAVALACEVLEHLPPAAFDAMRAELARVSSDHVFVSVPFRENRRRSDVICQGCGCRYNSMRHLRSFDLDDLEDLIPGFRLVRTEETGPRAPSTPGCCGRSSSATRCCSAWTPTCPQCSAVYDPRRAGATSSPAVGGATERAVDDLPAEPRAAGGLRSFLRPGSTYRLAQRFIPRRRSHYWVCALYEREVTPPARPR